MFRQPITIPNGAAVSNIVPVGAALAALLASKDYSHGALGRIIFPAGYEHAKVTIEECDDATDSNGQGGPIVDFDSTGTQFTASDIKTPAALPARVALDPALFCDIRYIRLRAPANVGADRVFGLLVRQAE